MFYALGFHVFSKVCICIFYRSINVCGIQYIYVDRRKCIYVYRRCVLLYFMYSRKYLYVCFMYLYTYLESLLYFTYSQKCLYVCFIDIYSYVEYSIYTEVEESVYTYIDVVCSCISYILTCI